MNHPYCVINTYVFEVSADAVDRERLAQGQEEAKQFTFDDTECFRIKECKQNFPLKVISSLHIHCWDLKMA